MTLRISAGPPSKVSPTSSEPYSDVEQNFLTFEEWLLTLKKCKFNGKFRGTDVYEWDPIEIPEDNDGLPAGAVWVYFPEKDDKDDGVTPTDR